MTRDATMTFLGAAGTVTGSKFLLDTGRSKVLVDAGMFQGIRELRRRNWDAFPIPPDSIDAIILSHAHLDHCGYLPALVAQGFAGPVFATGSTAQLAELVLRDSAKLQEEDARYATAKGYSKHAQPRPLYGTEDVEAVLPLFRELEYGCRTSVASGVEVTLQSAGHILGSSSVLTEVDGDRIVFSGDLGRPSHPLLRPPPPPPACESLVVESTYGDRHHEQDSGASVLAEIITRTVDRGGSVVIPAFAVDRTEVILMTLKRLTTEGRIPRLPVFVDSPMALGALRIYQQALTRDDPDLRADLGADALVFDPGELHQAHSVTESMAINTPRRPCIIISASGMATGGRVVHHLKHLLPDPRNTIVLVGYQSVGTRGRDLADGARQVKIHGRYVPVRAEVAVMNGFSVHADASELLDWLSRAAEAPRVVYVVHGEPQASAALAGRITDELGWTAVVPRDGERVAI